ncbi:MAG: glycosyltransferase family 2 protein [Acidobacteria bacterium]|nr:glycosyltransferase family 2 protein [Acidobacteriota bacterium]
MNLSIALITMNEEANLPRTLESVMPLVSDGRGEIIVLDSGSTDRTLEIARSFGAKIFVEPWKGFAAQKNSAMEKATGDWVLQLDADEAVEPGLAREICAAIHHPGAAKAADQSSPPSVERTVSTEETGGIVPPNLVGFWIPRKNFFLGRWIRHGGFYPDPKLRLIRRGAGKFAEYGAHPTIQVKGETRWFKGALVHNAYPSLRGYIDHMNSYSSSGAEVVVARGYRGFNPLNIVIRPLLTLLYNYFVRLGFLDGREGLLLHLYHAVYVSWKYAKAWELAKERAKGAGGESSN